MVRHLVRSLLALRPHAKNLGQRNCSSPATDGYHVSCIIRVFFIFVFWLVYIVHKATTEEMANLH